jgi:hypothetical protein
MRTIFIDIPKEFNVEPDFFRLRKLALDYAVKNLVGKSVVNANTGIEIKFSKKGFEHTAFSNATREQLLLIPAMPQILRHANLDFIEPAKKDKAQRIFRFITIVNANGKVFVVSTLAKKSSMGVLFYDHSTTKIGMPDIGFATGSQEGRHNDRHISGILNKSNNIHSNNQILR